MRKVFNIHYSQKSIDLAILLTRVVTAVLMLTHGVPKLMGLFGEGPVQFPGLFGMSPAVSLGLAVFAEFFCSVLILLGLGTRLAVIPPIITMLIAVLMIHAADPFTNKEPGLHFLLLYVILLITGSGKYSLDSFIYQKQLSAVHSNR